MIKPYKIKINFYEKTVMTDYEKSLRAALRTAFEMVNLKGCYFHYCKAIYTKCKAYKLLKKIAKKKH